MSNLSPRISATDRMQDKRASSGPINDEPLNELDGWYLRDRLMAMTPEGSFWGLSVSQSLATAFLGSKKGSGAGLGDCRIRNSHIATSELRREYYFNGLQLCHLCRLGRKNK